ncbi:MAG: tyrosine/phenylalanine carboxypeptidase domain-containing protein [Gemmatimonadota bacterium]
MIDDILERVARRESVHETLTGGGILSIDRGLPYLLVYREPHDRADPGTARLITSEASYLISRGGEAAAGLLVRDVAEAGSTTHGAFLVLEVWSGEDPSSRTFTIRAPDGPAPETLDKLAEGLRRLDDRFAPVDAVVERTDDRGPRGHPPLLTLEESWQTEVLLIGLEVPPIYREPESGEVYPRFLRDLRRALSRVFRQALYEFIRVQTASKVENHLALGTRTVPDAVWAIDRDLCRIEHSFDFLLLSSPVNRDHAWEQFRASGFERNPDFHYRLLPIDPDLMKRRLFDLEIEAIDDPALADLFEDKRQELDTQFSMLRERGTAGFRYSSHRLYGTVDDHLLRTAKDLLDNVTIPPRQVGRTVDAMGFRQAAVEELDYYSTEDIDLRDRVQIRRDISGLMVSEGVLLIGEDLRLEPGRVDPLIHHEVGTHVLTYVNGSAQPLEQLSLGLADYDEMQEGLAVLAEYLVGGLDHLRMRLLAARVVAANAVEAGAQFVDTFRILTKEYGYSSGGAWHVAVRVHASGGFTRDLVYLRGLVRLIDLLRTGQELRVLYTGKFALKHIGVIEELRHRRVLRTPPLTPRFLHSERAMERLEAVRGGIALTQMVSGAAA